MDSYFIYPCWTLGTRAADGTDKYVLREVRDHDEMFAAVKSGQTVNAVMDARLCYWKGKPADDTEVKSSIGFFVMQFYGLDINHSTE
jgi:hypothetical protein